MCCCGKPTINGQPGYSWDGKTFSVRAVFPPALDEGDELLYDEPGRCGGVDSHSFHFRVVKHRFGGFALLVEHGGGRACLSIGHRKGLIEALALLDTNARYWLLQSIYHMQQDAVTVARDKVNASWRQAAAEKRIKTRKNTARGTVKVWIA